MCLKYETKSKVWDMIGSPNISIIEAIDYIKTQEEMFYCRYRNNECLCFNECQKNGEVNQDLIEMTQDALKTYLIYKYVRKSLKEMLVGYEKMTPEEIKEVWTNYEERGKKC